MRIGPTVTLGNRLRDALESTGRVTIIPTRPGENLPGTCVPGAIIRSSPDHDPGATFDFACPERPVAAGLVFDPKGGDFDDRVRRVVDSFGELMQGRDHRLSRPLPSIYSFAPVEYFHTFVDGFHARVMMSYSVQECAFLVTIDTVFVQAP